jgi:ankyrin repeat protein
MTRDEPQGSPSPVLAHAGRFPLTRRRTAEIAALTGLTLALAVIAAGYWQWRLEQRRSTAALAALLAQESCPPETLLSLLARGAGVNTRSTSGRTALMAAAGAGDPALVEELLRRSASVNLRSRRGQTALLLASEGRITDRTGKHRAVIRRLLAAGADPNMRDQWGDSPLMYAASLGDAGLVKELLDRGATAHGHNDTMSTALDLARQGQHPEVVRLLQEAGAAD